MQDAQTLLPYEFARTHRLLLNAAQDNLVVAPGAPHWAIGEVGRCYPQAAGVDAVDDERFDHLLSELYSGRQNSSESVMADI